MTYFVEVNPCEEVGNLLSLECGCCNWRAGGSRPAAGGAAGNVCAGDDIAAEGSFKVLKIEGEVEDVGF